MSGPPSPPSRCVAFLRGLNVGGHRVKMSELAGWLDAAGYAGVSTFIASGNVVLDLGRSDAPTLAREEARIEALLGTHLGYDVATFLRSMDEVRALAEGEVSPDAAWTPHVMFFKEPVGAAEASAFEALATPEDRFVLRGREVVWLRRGRMSDSAVTQKDLERAGGGRPQTMRNLNTLRRLVAKFG